MKRKVTILFADLRDFSILVEKLPATQVISHLNQFLSLMIDIILEHKGTLDKFLGDGLMAEFGAPMDDPHQEKHAVEAAIAMQKALTHLNHNFSHNNLPTLQMVIGIHTGQAIMDYIGSPKHQEYTAIGDAVNIASRIEAAAKLQHIPILISETTLLPINFPTKEVAPIHLKNKSNVIKLFSVQY